MIFRICAISMCAMTLSACDFDGELLGNKVDKTVDGGLQPRHGLETGLTAGIWIDPNGCDHWIIDDGAEGYLSARLNDDGTPVCSGIGVPNTVVGPYNRTRANRQDSELNG